jgi:hypothetical protein
MKTYIAQWPDGTTLKAMKYICPEATEEVVKNIVPNFGLTYK